MNLPYHQTRHKTGFVTSHERQRWLRWATVGKEDPAVTIKDVYELDLPWYDRPSKSASESLIRWDLKAIGYLHVPRKETP